MNIQNPYVNTYLYSTVSLHPSQFGNDIYKHLKNNLARKLQGKCYKSYGYISKIYKIDERQGGDIIAEDPSASALYKVKFSCKICKPLKGTTIICEVMAINKSIIHLRNGPINVLIFEESGSINKNNFIFDDKKNVLLAKIGNNQKIPVVIGTHVEIKVVATRIEHNSNKILIMGTLENIASKAGTEESIKQREHDGLAFTNYDDYVETEKSFYKPNYFVAEKDDTDNTDRNENAQEEQEFESESE